MKEQFQVGDAHVGGADEVDQLEERRFAKHAHATRNHRVSNHGNGNVSALCFVGHEFDSFEERERTANADPATGKTGGFYSKEEKSFFLEGRPAQMTWPASQSFRDYDNGMASTESECKCMNIFLALFQMKDFFANLTPL